MPYAMSTEHLKHYVCHSHSLGWACGDGPEYMPCPYCERDRADKAEDVLRAFVAFHEGTENVALIQVLRKAKDILEDR